MATPRWREETPMTHKLKRDIQKVDSKRDAEDPDWSPKRPRATRPSPKQPIASPTSRLLSLESPRYQQQILDSLSLARSAHAEGSGEAAYRADQPNVSHKGKQVATETRPSSLEPTDPVAMGNTEEQISVMDEEETRSETAVAPPAQPSREPSLRASYPPPEITRAAPPMRDAAVQRIPFVLVEETQQKTNRQICRYARFLNTEAGEDEADPLQEVVDYATYQTERNLREAFEKAGLKR